MTLVAYNCSNITSELIRKAWSQRFETRSELFSFLESKSTFKASDNILEREVTWFSSYDWVVQLNDIQPSLN